MLYAIKSDTLFFNRQANRVDIEAFSYLYPACRRDADPQNGRRRKSRWIGSNTC
jgi:hypothetical protein